MKKWAAIGLLTVMVGCGGYDGPDEGQVEKRTFTPLHVEEGWRTQCVPHVGSKGEVSSTCFPVQYSVVIPDKWYLTISGCEDESKPKTCKRDSFEVTREMYDSVDIGMTVVYKDVKK